ncbi:unnamed protein product, partial [Hymenolepis diminuta]
YFTIQQIKPSWSELFVIAKSSVLSGLQVVDIATMRIGDYGSSPCVIQIMTDGIHKIAHIIWAHRVTFFSDHNIVLTTSLHMLSFNLDLHILLRGRIALTLRGIALNG